MEGSWRSRARPHELQVRVFRSTFSQLLEDATEGVYTSPHHSTTAAAAQQGLALCSHGILAEEGRVWPAECHDDNNTHLHDYANNQTRKRSLDASSRLLARVLAWTASKNASTPSQTTSGWNTAGVALSFNRSTRGEIISYFLFQVASHHSLLSPC